MIPPAGSVNSLETIQLRLPEPRPATLSEKIFDRVLGLGASPLAWFLAHFAPTPGLNLQVDAARWGLSLVGAHLPWTWLYQLVFAPIGLTRYFEFAFAFESLTNRNIERYLDVSSPRLLPLLVLDKNKSARADLLNPDSRDLAVTARLVNAKQWQARALLHECLLAEALFAPERFDVITSLSVIEHIPDDTGAIQKLWTWLRPQGHLILTMPCAARAKQIFINRDEYGVLPPDATGDYFLEYLYDNQRLEERIFAVTGKPARMTIYGERHANFLREQLLRRWVHPDRYDWSEAYRMGREFRAYASFAELPGEGVVCLEFVKG